MLPPLYAVLFGACIRTFHFVYLKILKLTALPNKHTHFAKDTLKCHYEDYA